MDASPFGMVELRRPIPLFWHNLPRLKPAVWFTARTLASLWLPARHITDVATHTQPNILVSLT